MPVEIPTNRLDYTSPRIWTAFVNDLPLPGTFRGSTYLPMRDIEADRILVEIGKYARLMAPFADIDAESGTINRGRAIVPAWFDALHIKVKERFLASELRWLRMYGDAPVSSPAGRMADVQRRRIAEAMTDLNLAVDTRVEWMQMHALQGRVTQAPDADSNVSIDIQYAVATVTASPLWSATTTADPVKDIWTWTKAGVARGLKYSRLIISLATSYDLMVNAKLRADFSTPTNTPSMVTMAQINERLSGQFGITVEIYDTVYTSRSDNGATITDTLTSILPDATAILLPDQPVGYTGTVPQELNNWNTGKYTWRNDPSNNPGMQDPIRHEMGVGWGGMPIITFPDRILVATVA